MSYDMRKITSRRFLELGGVAGIIGLSACYPIDTHFTSRVDLFISGHTHGGQVDIPFIGPPVLPVRNKTYSSGLKRSTRGTPVFISRGIGWAILPVRFNCFPEIAVLELFPSGIKT